MIFYTFSVIGVVAVGLCVAEELPVTICKRNSPNYSNCLKLAIEESWPRFVKGLPEFDFPSLDPLSYEYGEFEFERNEIYGRVSLSNVINKGLTNISFLSVRPHFLDDGFRLEIDSNVPKMFVKGNCKAEGKVGGFQMGGKGRFNLTLENIKGTWDLIGNVTNDRWTVEHFHFLPSVGNMKIHFDDLFNGNEELNNLAMFFVNEYWPILYRAMLPITSEKWDPWLADMANSLFSKVSFSKLFP